MQANGRYDMLSHVIVSLSRIARPSAGRSTFPDSMECCRLASAGARIDQSLGSNAVTCPIRT